MGALPCEAEVLKVMQERKKALRDRIIEGLRVQNAEKRSTDLRIIAECYAPLDAGILAGCKQDGCNLSLGQDLVLWTDSTAAAAPLQRSLRITGSAETGIEESCPGVFVFDLLSKDVCERLWKESVNYLQCAKQGDLPLPMRHDGGLDLSYVFPELLAKIAEVAMPALRKVLPTELHDVFLQHAFRTFNYVGRDEHFKRHVDKYAVTLNVCLHKTPGVQGSGVLFYESQEADIYAYRYEHEVGRACLHSSKEWHMTERLTAGERGSVIMWFNRSNSEV